MKFPSGLLLLPSQVSGIQPDLPADRHSEQHFYGLPISCSQELNVWWVMFRAACQEDRALLSQPSLSEAF